MVAQREETKRGNSVGYRVTDMDVTYCRLMFEGPMSFADLVASLNWTRYRTNQALYRLRRDGCVRLTFRNAFVAPHRWGAKRYGLWEIVSASERRERANCAFLAKMMTTEE